METFMLDDNQNPEKIARFNNLRILSSKKGATPINYGELFSSVIFVVGKNIVAIDPLCRSEYEYRLMIANDSYTRVRSKGISNKEFSKLKGVLNDEDYKYWKVNKKHCDVRVDSNPVMVLMCFPDTGEILVPFSRQLCVIQEFLRNEHADNYPTVALVSKDFEFWLNLSISRKQGFESLPSHTQERMMVNAIRHLSGYDYYLKALQNLGQRERALKVSIKMKHKLLGTILAHESLSPLHWEARRQIRALKSRTGYRKRQLLEDSVNVKVLS